MTGLIGALEAVYKVLVVAVSLMSGYTFPNLKHLEIDEELFKYLITGLFIFWTSCYAFVSSPISLLDDSLASALHSPFRIPLTVSMLSSALVCGSSFVTSLA